MSNKITNALCRYKRLTRLFVYDKLFIFRQSCKTQIKCIKKYRLAYSYNETAIHYRCTGIESKLKCWMQLWNYNWDFDRFYLVILCFLNAIVCVKIYLQTVMLLSILNIEPQARAWLVENLYKIKNKCSQSSNMYRNSMNAFNNLNEFAYRSSNSADSSKMSSNFKRLMKHNNEVLMHKIHLNLLLKASLKSL